MRSAQIVRHYAKDATTGFFLWNEKAIAVTLELPWRNNERKISCIPEGLYLCERVRNRTTTGGTQIDDTFIIANVKDRDGILFHVGNSTKDSNGCILIGNNFAIVDGKQAILNSRIGFGYFIKTIDYPKTFHLKISSAT